MTHSTSRPPSPVAIIGAGGFLGTNLGRSLTPHVEDLRCFGRRQSFPDALRGLHWIDGDISDTDTAALDGALAGCATVIHLASTSTPATADRNISADAQENIVGSLKLFDRCIAAGVKRVVFISSGGTVYGIPESTPIPESAPTQPITAYGVAKLAIEKYLELYRRQHGLEYRALRVANVYGPFQTGEKQQGVVAAFLSKALSGKAVEIWGDGQVVRDYVYVADVAEAVVAAARHQGEHRVFNIGSGVGLSLTDIISAIENLLGHNLEKHFKPARATDVPINILDCGLAKTALGWQANTTFMDGLDLTTEWMKASILMRQKS